MWRHWLHSSKRDIISSRSIWSIRDSNLLILELSSKSWPSSITWWQQNPIVRSCSKKLKRYFLLTCLVYLQSRFSSYCDRHQNTGKALQRSLQCSMSIRIELESDSNKGKLQIHQTAIALLAASFLLCINTDWWVGNFVLFLVVC